MTSSGLNGKKKYKTKDGRSEQYFDGIKPISLFGEKASFKAYSLGPVSGKPKNYSAAEFRHFFRFIMKHIKQFEDLDLESIDFSEVSHVDRNAVSGILGIKSEPYVLHFGGDASSDTWEASLKQIKHSSFSNENILHPDFLKASHHGAGHSSSKKMWENLFEEEKKQIYVGISAGKKHEHPTDKFYKELTACCNKKGITPEIFRTNECKICCSKNNVVNTSWYEQSKKRMINLYGLEVMEVLDNDLPKSKKRKSIDDEPCNNLMAYIFEFPVSNSSNKTKNNTGIKVHRAVSNQIGTYNHCVLKHSACYCT